VVQNKTPIIDILRGIAALLVAYLHCREMSFIGLQKYSDLHGFSFSPLDLVTYMTYPVIWGSIGVPVFFVISGYCIHRSEAKKTAAGPGGRALGLKSFYLKRFIRIYPLLAAALILTSVFDALSAGFAPGNVSLGDNSGGSFLINLFAMQGIFGKTYGSNGPLWTLSIEIQFYLVYPLLFWALAKLGWKTVFLLIAAINVASYFLFERNGITIFTSYYLSWCLGAYLAEFKLREDGAAAPRNNKTLFIASAALIFLVSCAVFFRSKYISFQLWALSFSMFLYAVLDYNPPAGFAVQALKKVGDFSYSLYIIHLPFVILLMSLVFHGERQSNIFVSFALMIGLFPFAYLVYACVERPSLNLLKKLKSSGAA
jgi:peptidoglycan/LPS O-acetylase OafA/YrhL